MRRSTVITLAVLLILAAVMIWTSFSDANIECEMCMTYDGRINCARAAAPTEEEAERSAKSTACATIAAGRAQSLECERTSPTRRECTP